MKPILALPVAFALSLFAVSCAPQTPASRISARPDAFERLGGKEKELVRRGEIAKGMGMDAVSLAWGSPSARVEGLRNGRRMERWDYRGTRPVVHETFHGGYGHGYYGPYRYSGIGVRFGPDVTYLPYTRASVWFVNGRVDEWQRER